MNGNKLRNRNDWMDQDWVDPSSTNGTDTDYPHNVLSGCRFQNFTSCSARHRSKGQRKKRPTYRQGLRANYSIFYQINPMNYLNYSVFVPIYFLIILCGFSLAASRTSLNTYVFASVSGLVPIPVATRVTSSNDPTVWYDPTEVLVAEQIRILQSNPSMRNYGSIAVTDIETQTRPVHAESTETKSCQFYLNRVGMLLLDFVLTTFEFLLVAMYLVFDFVIKLFVILVFVFISVACVYLPLWLVYLLSYVFCIN